MKYKLNNETVTRQYKFLREKVFEEKGFFFKRKVIFYKEGVILPLDIDFKSSEFSNKEISDIIDNNVYYQFVNSANKKLNMDTLTVVFIVIAVLIVVAIIIKKVFVGG